jgi:hypothetical protein
MISEGREIQERNRSTMPANSTMATFNNGFVSERLIANDGTLTNKNQDETIVPEQLQKRTLINTNRQDTETDTFQSSSCNTMIELSSESSDTMIINENGTETEYDADSQQDTLKVYCSLNVPVYHSHFCEYKKMRLIVKGPIMSRRKKQILDSMILVDSSGSCLILVNSDGSLWVLMDLSGFLWILMDPCRFRWILMGPVES